ncbi:proton-conducting membrane transporter [Myxococcus sp. K15C18031901]|uniref:proton-conducting transporter transmembrane domain-containing protein n=1 Tax=Myxococcus dinghuensis TaxID=2906761 RepID=UPI0020A759D6|nr:proton-conducting transporter membrane subunit [Myxococcus dinghuensis]MCP3100941.1 proton-conducting membrane transporter [Myxococcus dinghuensis]
MAPPDLDPGWLAAAVALAPLLAFLAVGAALLVGRAPSERGVARAVVGALWLSLGCALTATAWWALHPHAVLATTLPFGGPFLVDALSAPMLVLVSVITLWVGRFAIPYLHREPGFARFFLLLALFAAGMQLLVGAGSLEVLAIGWELVGLSSALLIGFFQERASPVRAGLRAFGTYRLCDVGLFMAVAWLHHAAGDTRWPEPTRALPTTALALCLLLAAMGKSAQFPFSGWLARAMEGPTPSSALFYGALSIHAGPYLLLRAAPLLEHAPVVRGALVLVGLLTALQATLAWRVQTDVKGALAQGVLTQVGLMFVEVGLGLYSLALLHLVAHAGLRCLQFLRAPSALRQAQAWRAALRDTPPPSLVWLHRFVPRAWAPRLYRLAMERFAVDALYERWLLHPLLRLGRALDAAERRWVGTLSAAEVPPPTPARPAETSPSNPSTGAV